MAGDIQFDANGGMRIVDASAIDTTTLEAGTVDVTSRLEVKRGSAITRISPGRVSTDYLTASASLNAKALSTEAATIDAADIGRPRRRDEEGVFNGVHGRLDVFDAQRMAPTVSIDGQSGVVEVAGEIRQTSDLRAKDDVRRIDGALGRLAAISGITWSPAGGGPRRAGVAAQEVERVLPEAVSGSGEALRSVSYAGLVGLLVEAVRELQDEIAELKAAQRSGAADAGAA